MAPKPKALAQSLSRRGPHKVLRGELDFAGLPGLVCTPESGLGLPAVVFGHGWLASPARYLQTLAHLASWGIVAAAPGTERGPVPSARAFAEDLYTAAEICVGVRLGSGNISVQPDRVAFAGHGFGAGAAVLAAAALEKSPLAPRGAAAQAKSHPGHTAAAVGLLYPEPVSPAAEDVAAHVSAPALLLSAPAGGALAPPAAALAETLGGEVTDRIVPAAADGSIGEGRYLQKFLGLPGSDRKLQTTTRAQLTGYLLATLSGGKDGTDYAPFTDRDTDFPGATRPLTEEERAEAAKPGVVENITRSLPGAQLVRLARR